MTTETEWSFVVSMFSQFPVFRDPCTSKVFLLFLKRYFFKIGDRYIMGRQVLFSLSVTTMSGLFALITLSDWTGMSQYSHRVGLSYSVDGSCS